MDQEEHSMWVPERHTRYLAGALLFGLTVLVAVAGADVFGGRPVLPLFNDPATHSGTHPLVGAISNMGVLLWWTSASIWLFTASLLRSRADRAAYKFALASGLLSAYLGLDDLYLLHDELLPEYLGLPQDGAVAAVGLTTIAYFVAFRRFVFRREAVALLVAAGLLGASAFVDGVFHASSQSTAWKWLYLLEDSLKWLGILCWGSFCLAWCVRAVLGLTMAARDGGS